MDKLTARLLYKGENIERQNVLWNTAGELCYALASMVLSMLVMRMVGDDQGGIFLLRLLHAGPADVHHRLFWNPAVPDHGRKGEYSFKDYLEHRNLTCLIALVVGCVFLTGQVAAKHYTPYKALILILLVLYKVIDGYADVYESEFQRRGSLYLTGKSNFFRTLLSVFCFLAALAVTRSLLAACLTAVAAQVAGVCLFNLPVIHAVDG